MRFLSDLSRQECHRYTTVNQVSNNAASRMGHGRNRCFVYADNFLNSHGLNTRFRTFKVRGGFRQHLYCSEYTEGFTRPEFSRTRSSTSTQSTRYDLRTAHVRGEMKHEFRTVQVRGEIKPGLHTVCQATSHCSYCADQTEGSIRTVRRARTQTCSWQNSPSGVGVTTSNQEHNTNRESSTTRRVTQRQMRKDDAALFQCGQTQKKDSS